MDRRAQSMRGRWQMDRRAHSMRKWVGGWEGLMCWRAQSTVGRWVGGTENLLCFMSG